MTETTFSLDLNQDQRDIRDWVHGFAEGVVRPAAAEWDEREETPWPIIGEAPKIGLYGFEALAQFWSRRDRADAADRQRGALLGRRRHRHGDHGHLARGRGDLRRRAPASRSASGSRSASARPRSPPSPRSACPSPTPAPTSRRCARARSTTRPRTSGSSTARRRGRPTAASPTCTSSSPRVEPELGSRGQAAFVVPPGTPGLTMGTKVKKHGLRASHTADVFLDDCRVPGSCLLGGKEKLDERLARAREGTRSRAGRPRCRRSRPSRPTVGAQAIGIARAAYEYALEYAERAASSSAGRSSRTRRSRSRSPT